MAVFEMPPPIVQFNFDFSPLTRAIHLGLKSTTRGIPKFLGTQAYRIAWKAGKATPFVPISRMDAELDARATLRDGRENTAGLTVGEAIVLARANPGSRYNQLTDSRWALPAGLGAGGYGQLAKRVFFDRLESYAERQKSARHSSSHFLQSGWKQVKNLLRALGYRAGTGFNAADGGDARPENRLSTERLGAVVQGGQGSRDQWLRIENSVGMEGTSNLAYSRNQALHDYGGPALQRATDEVAQELRDWNTAKDLEADLLAAWNSVPNARPLDFRGRHNTLGNHLDSAAMSEDAAVPFSR